MVATLMTVWVIEDTGLQPASRRQTEIGCSR